MNDQTVINESFNAFCKAEAIWLDDAAFFHVLSHIVYPDQPWWTWRISSTEHANP